MADNYGNNPEKRATSLDDLALLQYFRKEPRICFDDSKQQQKAVQDDCSMYMMSRASAKAFVGMNGWKRSETKYAAHITNVNPFCRCHCGRQKTMEPSFDPIASPGPRSLLHFLPSEAVDSPSASFKIPAAVPFGWEEVPGKPKIDPANSKPDRSLQLPPRLLCKSFVADRAGIRPQTKSVSHVLRSSSHGKKEKSFYKNLFHRSADLGIMRRSNPFFSGGYPNSPRSVLVDPHLYSGSSSSSSQPSCILDSETLPPTAPVLEIWTDLTSIAGQEPFLADGEGEYAAFSGEHCWLQFESPLKEFAPPEWPDSGNSGDQWARTAKSIGKIFRLIKGRSLRKQRTSSDVPMWAPTLAAYFQSTTKSEQIELLKHPDGEGKLSRRNASQLAISAVDEKPGVEVPPSICVCHCRSWDRALQAHQLPKSSPVPLKSTKIEWSQSHAAHEDLSAGVSEENTENSHRWSPACGSWLSSPQLRSVHSGRWQRKVKTRLCLMEIHRSSSYFALLVKAMKNFFIVSKK